MDSKFMTRIVLAEDHFLMRQKLKQLLASRADVVVVGEAANGEEALRLTLELQPDLLITDLSMPRLHGLELTLRLQQIHSAARVVIVSVTTEDPYVLAALRNGAQGYVGKDSCREYLLPAIEAVRSGQPYLSPPLDPNLLLRYHESTDSAKAEKLVASE